MTYIPTTAAERQQMLATCGANRMEELFNDIPATVRLGRELDLPRPMAEAELWRHLEELAGKNKRLISFLGAGAYEHYIPSVVGNLLARSEFYTAYTPYQPEISQGTLQAIFEFQSLMCELTGLDVATASHYDGATATAEAALVTCNATRRQKILVSRAVNPQYRAVLATYTKGQGVELVEIPMANGQTDLAALEKMAGKDVAGVILQNPNFFGQIEPMAAATQLAHKAGALSIAVVDPISLGLLAAPGEYGADLAVGEGQGLGNPLNFGGPYLGFIVAREKLVRRLPGRIVGQTTDVEGKRAFVLTLQAREQHIRREKATSNICSNEALCALAATIYLAALGKEGLKEVARQCLLKAHYAFNRLAALPGVTPVFNGPFFCEFVLRTKLTPGQVAQSLAAKGFAAGFDLNPFYPELEGAMLFTVTEVRTRAEIDAFVTAMGGILA
ncbi:MAG: glycine dehydrogenase subunit 1 [Moorella sp. (in: firmicutes)]|jgi:glycine dehydrogenase subunit 1|uniref:aminomethyl-transferring glycine dehydrogenase subunit GcvPA n=1 Tax=Moorella sp. E306M TaxID=2572683 RepID=UPI0010FFBECA|nr:aminomethyl-transferring glycine dehydrogenase subunit GcvPA [Moorella sp. E306M]MDK2815887.1 glycine dehydrogenase subunit 1 [Moorella sp. (in: firmicutes)]GEA18738.1 putative glycine dehydrogenase (decarboxylating) subunit 1 [Moorella sp. E306M]